MWFAVASLACTAVLFLSVGPWLQTSIKLGLDSFLVGKSKQIEIRARHDPSWRERHDFDNNVSHGWSFLKKLKFSFFGVAARGCVSGILIGLHV